MQVGVLNNPKVSFYETLSTSCVEKPTLSSKHFKSGVVIPSQSWKRADCEYVKDTVELNGRNLILIKLDDSIIHHAHQSIIEILKKNQNYNTLQNSINSALQSSLAKSVKAEIEEILPVDIELDTSIIAVNFHHLYPQASLIEKSSTTHDPKTECGLRGLHVDNWNDPPLLPIHRHKASYKLLYNLGTEGRDFVFSEFPVNEMALQSESIVSGSDEYLDYVNSAYFASPLVESYLHSTTKIQIKRINYQPGSCLIAPVQNLIHDGYLNYLSTADICLQSRVHTKNQ